MVQAVIITLSIAVLCICACGLVQELKRAGQKRKERAEQKRYLKKFRESQKECDSMFRERERDERSKRKWEKQNITCKNPEFAVFWR